MSPFHGKSYHEVLAKNKEGTVKFDEQYWSAVSTEAKDLVAKMTAKEPSERIASQDALDHPWFAIAATKVGVLSSAVENMKKYHNENRFNVGKIKPEFAMVTRTPLLASRFGATPLKDSPLILSKAASPFALSPTMGSAWKATATGTRSGSGNSPPGQAKAGENSGNRPKVLLPAQYPGIRFNNIEDKWRSPTNAPVKLAAKNIPASFNPPEEEDKDDETADFKESEIDERNESDRRAAKPGVIYQSFVPQSLQDRRLPQTPGFTQRKLMTYLKTIGTPMQGATVDRHFGKKPAQEPSYLARLVKHKMPQVKPQNTAPTVFKIVLKDPNPIPRKSLDRVQEAPSFKELDQQASNSSIKEPEEVKQVAKFNIRANLLMTGATAKRSPTSPSSRPPFGRPVPAPVSVSVRTNASAVRNALLNHL